MPLCIFFFFFNDTATTEIYTLSLHDALPISALPRTRDGERLRHRQGPLRERHGYRWVCDYGDGNHGGYRRVYEPGASERGETNRCALGRLRARGGTLRDARGGAPGPGPQRAGDRRPGAGRFPAPPP